MFCIYHKKKKGKQIQTLQNPKPKLLGNPSSWLITTDNCRTKKLVAQDFHVLTKFPKLIIRTSPFRASNFVFCDSTWATWSRHGSHAKCRKSIKTVDVDISKSWMENSLTMGRKVKYSCPHSYVRYKIVPASIWKYVKKSLSTTYPGCATIIRHVEMKLLYHSAVTLIIQL